MDPDNLPEFGGIRVVCSSRITGTDLGTVALVISSFTTATDLVAMVITKCKVIGINAEDYCVVMETGYKEKGGGLETKILEDEDNPLTMQASKPRGQVRQD
ncbi:uncharacterized protein LOC135464462 [Liolophura sinensis]|uniref:uncharacterized protein LOC135464462 n=1 Tax=Liolophura sinensis TaxID=3198878 RepID=UPI003158353A